MPHHDVIVIGAGLAGLRAASLLLDAGRDVRVLEARSRVGGRTKSGPVGGALLDLGGQWIGPTQGAILALADQLNVARFPTHCRGKKILEIGTRISTYSGSIPALSVSNLLELQLLIRRIDKLARTVPRGAPHEAPDAALLDRLSVSDWQDKHIKRPGTRAMVDLLVQSILSAEPDEVSMLFLLHYIHCAGGVDPLATVKGGGQEQRFVRGAQELSSRMAERLGDRVVLECPAEAIEHSPQGVTVKSGSSTWSGSCALITAPPPVAARIPMIPALPDDRLERMRSTKMGDTLKCLLLYGSPFWRDKGFSGETISHSGSITFGFDNTSHDGNQAGLVAFVTGARARALRLRGHERVREQIVSELVRYWGEEARHVEHFEVEDWSTEPWSGGGPTGYAPPGTLTTADVRLAAPLEPLFFAGTETATQWCGFMEGAVSSGERAAREIEQYLTRQESR